MVVLKNVVDEKVVEKAGDVANKATGNWKILKKAIKAKNLPVAEAADLTKKGEKATKETIDLVDSKKISYSTFTKIATGTVVVGVAVGVATAIKAKQSFDARNGKEFRVNEISYDPNDDIDEISLSITNPELLPIYVRESILFLTINSNYDVLKNKINEKKILLNDLDYKITEVNPYGADTIPTLIKVKISGIDLTGADKDMIMKGDGLFIIKLRADFNNDIGHEFDNNVINKILNMLKNTAEAPFDIFNYVIQIVKTIGLIFGIIFLLYLAKVVYDTFKK
jgi:hypothetical protein